MTNEQQDKLLKKIYELQQDLKFLHQSILDNKTNPIQERVISAAIDAFNKTLNS